MFSNGADAAREITISDVTERNEGGDPKEIIGLNGARSKIRYGALGRKYFVWASTGASSASTWALCSSGNCPANMGLAYVMTTTSPAAPASKTIYDLLGRPTISLQQGWQWSVDCHDHPLRQPWQCRIPIQSIFCRELRQRSRHRHRLNPVEVLN